MIRGAALLLLLALGASCKPRQSDPASAATTDERGPTKPEVPPDAGPAPLVAEWIERIDLPGGGFAFVAPPVGSRERRPIVVAIHGAVDDPGLMCSAYRLITDVFPFVVCPAGAKAAPANTYVWTSSDLLDKRALAAIDAVRARYPERVAEGPVVYAAFSQGANMARELLARRADVFQRAILTEGGYHAFDDEAVARAFVARGGERVLFTCSQAGCAGAFGASVRALRRARARVEVEDMGPLGHALPPAARTAIHTRLPFVVEGLAGWEAYAKHPKLASH